MAIEHFQVVGIIIITLKRVWKVQALIARPDCLDFIFRRYKINHDGPNKHSDSAGLICIIMVQYILSRVNRASA